MNICEKVCDSASFSNLSLLFIYLGDRCLALGVEKNSFPTGVSLSCFLLFHSGHKEKWSSVSSSNNSLF